MKTLPDFNRIGSVVSSWQRGVVTAGEAEKLIQAAMDPASRLPASEMVPLPQADESMRIMLAVAERIEQKLNLVIRHLAVSLPETLNPGNLSPEIIELADRDEKIEAVALHRRNTGASLAETCELLQRHLRERERRRRSAQKLLSPRMSIEELGRHFTGGNSGRAQSPKRNSGSCNVVFIPELAGRAGCSPATPNWRAG